MSKKTRNRIILLIILALIAALFLLLAFEIYQSKHNLEVSHYEIQSDQLDHNFRVVHLSDIHDATFGRNNEILIAAVQEEEPDIILITGDLVNSKKAFERHKVYEAAVFESEVVATLNSSMNLVYNLLKIAPVYISYGNQDLEVEEILGVDFQHLFNTIGAVFLEPSSLRIEQEKENIASGYSVLQEHTDILEMLKEYSDEEISLSDLRIKELYSVEGEDGKTLDDVNASINEAAPSDSDEASASDSNEAVASDSDETAATDSIEAPTSDSDKAMENDAASDKNPSASSKSSTGYLDLEVNGQKIRLGGLYGYCLPEKYAQENNHQDESDYLKEFQDTDRYTILMSHLPLNWRKNDSLYDWNIDTVFAGHVHGGQVILPGIGGIWAPDMGFFPGRLSGLFTTEEEHFDEVIKKLKEYKANDLDNSYYEGEREYEPSTLVLSRGIGNTEAIPRINNRPEIVVVDFCKTDS